MKSLLIIYFLYEFNKSGKINFTRFAKFINKNYAKLVEQLFIRVATKWKMIFLSVYGAFPTQKFAYMALILISMPGNESKCIKKY